MSKVYDIITDQIIEDLENGIAPWECPWFGSLRNPASDHDYRGVNRILLGSAMQREEYDSPLFLTYRQAKKLGGHVRKGEASHIVTFFKFVKKKTEEEDSDDDEKKIPVLRYYRVFNVAQVDGIDADNLPAIEFNALDDAERNDVAEEFIAATGATIEHSGNPRAFYSPVEDKIHLPNFATFKSARGYYSTAVHELTHWTGHPSRLDRQLFNRFGDDEYAAEELIAELGAAYTMGRLGFEYSSQSASYLSSWLQVLRADKYAIFTASREAQTAADYLAELTGLEPQETDDEKAA